MLRLYSTLLAVLITTFWLEIRRSDDLRHDLLPAPGDVGRATLQARVLARLNAMEEIQGRIRDLVDNVVDEVVRLDTLLESEGLEVGSYYSREE